MTKLSLQAQAVLDAVREICPAPADEIAAVALKAAAEQVVPETTTPWNSTLTPMISAGEVRAKFLAIAAELEGGNG
jgi:hypothetical protein